MSDLVHFEYPPPRSWEQFEELCADLFEAMWSDPGLTRHGRAGQTQFGVDIVAARGGIRPVGLQCKKKSHWPVKKLSANEIDAEVAEAEKFHPSLREFYILTTAVTDERLQRHVRTLNESRVKQKKFSIVILFWPEIVRRVAQYERVARKHFPVGGGSGEFSPLLATWYTTGGKLELTDSNWHLAVCELGEDFHQWPTGHVVIRQRETDALMEKLHGVEKKLPSPKARLARIQLRRELRYMRDREKRIEETIRMLYTNERLKVYMLDLDVAGVDASELLQAIIERELHQGPHDVCPQKIRLFPPAPELLTGPRSSSSVADSDLPIHMSNDAYAEILEAERKFPKRYYGNAMVKVVSELPRLVRTRVAIPAIIQRVQRIMLEDKKTLAEMQLAGYLDLHSWKYEH